MRNKFADTVYKIGKKNKKICAIVADISPAGSMEKFRNEFPNRFINCGVAEQSMIGIAAGLALKGMRPFCYTIASFAIFRPFEMIRVDLAYQKLPVTVIGMGAGVIYHSLGSTHHTMEDISLASSIPNMTVLAPCDPLEMQLATEWCATKNKGPVYMRLGKVGEPNLTKNACDKFQIGKLRYITKGDKVCIVSYGTITKKAIEIAEELKKFKIHCSIVSFHTIKPLDKNGIKKLLNKYKILVIVEENVFNGGLASQIKSINSDLKTNTKILNYNLKDKFIKCYSSYNELLKLHGISNKKIINDIKHIYG